MHKPPKPWDKLTIQTRCWKISTKKQEMIREVYDNNKNYLHVIKTIREEKLSKMPESTLNIPITEVPSSDTNCALPLQGIQEANAKKTQMYQQALYNLYVTDLGQEMTFGKWTIFPKK